jgi:hypothetical protein
MNEQSEDLFDRGMVRQTDITRQRQREIQKGYRIESHHEAQEWRRNGDTLERDAGEHRGKCSNGQKEERAEHQSDRQGASNQRQRERRESWQVIRSQDIVQGREEHGLRQGRGGNSRGVNEESYQREMGEMHTHEEGHNSIRAEYEADGFGNKIGGERPNVGLDKAVEDQERRPGQHLQTRHRVRWWDIH